MTSMIELIHGICLTQRNELDLDLYNLNFNSLSLTQGISEPTRSSNLLDLVLKNNPNLLIDSAILDPMDDLIITQYLENATVSFNIKKE